MRGDGARAELVYVSPSRDGVLRRAGAPYAEMTAGIPARRAGAGRSSRYRRWICAHRVSARAPRGPERAAADERAYFYRRAGAETLPSVA